MLTRIAITDIESPAPFEPIVRDRLVRRLVSAAAHRVTIVAAAAGFGKSVAVRHYLEQCGVEHVRFALRRENETLPGFLRGFAAAIAPIAPSASRIVPSILGNVGRSEGTTAHIGAWLAEAMEHYAHTILVDDLHYAATDARIGEVLSEIVDRCPRVRWIIATRDTLELPIASWTAYGISAPLITEADLRLTSQDAAMIADHANTHYRSPEICQLYEATKGWPVAFSFALRVATRCSDLRSVATGTREMLFAFLAQQVLKNLNKGERSFLFRTALLPTFDVPLLETIGISDATQTLERISHRTGLASSDGDGTFRYHDLFREFLDDRIRRRGIDAYEGACTRAASSLAAVGRIPEALELYSRTRRSDAVATLLRCHGLTLLDNGALDVVEAALAIIPVSSIDTDALLLAISAALHSCRGNHDRAVAVYDRAQRAAQNASERFEIVNRYATVLIYPYQRYTEALSLLESISENELITSEMQARNYSGKAFLYSELGYVKRALQLEEQANAAAWNSSDEIAQLKTWLTISSIASMDGRPRDTIRLLTRVAAKAEAIGYLMGALSAKNQLVMAEYALANFDNCRAALKEVVVLAKRLAYVDMQWWCRVVEYDLAIMRGDDTIVLGLEEQIVVDAPRRPVSYMGLKSADALREACVGNFGQAYGLVAVLNVSDSTLGDRLLASAQSVLYAAAAGLRVEAEEASNLFQQVFALVPSHQVNSFFVSRARAFFALGALLLGRSATCDNTLRSLEAAAGSVPGVVICLVRAIRAMYFRWQTNGDDGQVRFALSELRSTAIGGYAKVLERISLPAEAEATPFASLTKTELQVLGLVGSGLTSRLAGARLGRSALTIDAHVKAIARKLGCRGRREAIALAREHGIV